jgi:hypothetical protein
MKNLVLFTVIAFSALISMKLGASHNRGGEITYKRIAPYTKVVGGSTVAVYNYSIIVTKCHGNGVGMAERCVDTVYFGDGTKGVALRINGQPCSSCPSNVGCGAMVNANSSTSVKLSIYAVEHTFPGPGSYLIRSLDPNRNDDIANIPNSVNFPYYLEAMLVINSFMSAQPNSSPVFSSFAVDRAQLNKCYYHDPLATDADGDSLSYEISTARDFNGQTIAGYFFPNTGTGGNYGIHPTTGTLSWCKPQSVDLFVLAYLVKEWRKNTNGVYQMIGYVLRDMEVEVVPYPLGVEEQKGLSVKIVPNPATVEFEIQLSNELLVQSYIMYNCTGQVVLKGTFAATNNNPRLRITDLPAGVYFLNVESENRIFSEKVVKE